MKRILLLLSLLLSVAAQASVSFSSTQVAEFQTGGNTDTITLTSVPAGATLVVGVLNRTDETTTISSISDDVNGAWTLNYVDGGPVDFTNGTSRAWVAYRNNVASGTTIITVNFSGNITSQVAAGWMLSSLGAMTFHAAATATQFATGTNLDSNTVSASGAGAIVGLLSTGNSQADPEPTADGAGESRITSGAAGARAFLFVESFGGSGTYGLETTADSTVGLFQVGAFLEPAAGTGIILKRRKH